MGFQGQLSSVNLTDIFQTLHMNRQTGTLSVMQGDSVQHIWFDGGQVAMASALAVDGRPFLLSVLMRKGLLSAEQASELAARMTATRQPLRELVLAANLVPPSDLDEVAVWCIEEMVCPVFEWRTGDFTFTDGTPVAALQTADTVVLGEQRLPTTQLLLEATRREDEWKRIREVITDPNALFLIDNDGRANLRSIDSDPEMLKVLRYLDGRHTIDDIANAVSVSRFDCFAIVAQLVNSRVARPCTPQELIADAESLRAQGELTKAVGLLEGVLRLGKVPEVIRPLAELCAALNQVPRAVELYLEVIQLAQDQGQLEQALADLDVVIKLSPDDPDLHFDRAHILAELNQLDEAAKAFVAAAIAYLNTRDVPKAIDACHRAKNALPRAPEPHRFLAKAYLMDGQTDNAVVEYKSLWHALLSLNRPRKALDQLKEFLESDCKFAAVKTQIVAYAESSDAVKTGNSLRWLVRALTVAVIGVGAWQGYMLIQGQWVISEGRHAVERLRQDKDKALADGQHAAFIARAEQLRSDYYRHSAVSDPINALIIEVQGDQSRRADGELSAADALRTAGDLDAADAAFARVKERYLANPALAGKADAGRQAVLDARSLGGARRRLAELEAAWQQERWEEALAGLHAVRAGGTLPTALATPVADRLAQWSVATADLDAQVARVGRMAAAGRDVDALKVLRDLLATAPAPRRADVERRLASLELARLERVRAQMDEAFTRDDAAQAFALLDELRDAVRQSTSKEATQYLARVRLPFALRIDSQHTVLTVSGGSDGKRTLRAPTGTSGPWSHLLTYAPGETLTIDAQRIGFAAERVQIAAAGKRAKVELTLKRGPLWQQDLHAVATTAPVASGSNLLIGTDRSTLEVIDAGLGARGSVVFDDTVSAVSSSAVVHRGFAHLLIDNRLVVVDLSNRTVALSFPGKGQSELPRLNPASLFVQDNELIPDQVLAFAGSGTRLHIVGLNGREVAAYPGVTLENGVTGGLYVDHFAPLRQSTLYVPSGPQLIAYDVSTIARTSPPQQRFAVRTRGEVVGRPLRAEVAGAPAILFTDSTGLVLVIDADPTVPEARRSRGSWPLEGAATHSPAYRPGLPVAYVAVSEGRLLALDLANPGKLLWRFPRQGTLGPLPGAPVIGAKALYIADANGVLYAIDPVTGVERWRADLGARVATGILAHEGRIYVPTKGAMSGPLLCFEEGDD